MCSVNRELAVLQGVHPQGMPEDRELQHESTVQLVLTAAWTLLSQGSSWPVPSMHSMTQHACGKAWPTIQGKPSRGAVCTVPCRAAFAERQAMNEGPWRGVGLSPAVDAATAGGCDALNLLHASVRLKLGL